MNRKRVRTLRKQSSIVISFILVGPITQWISNWNISCKTASFLFLISRYFNMVSYHVTLTLALTYISLKYLDNIHTLKLGYILQKGPLEMCDTCNKTISVKHTIYHNAQNTQFPDKYRTQKRLKPLPNYKTITVVKYGKKPHETKFFL